ncbi:MAG: hypothetical protein SWH61_16625 [Thermodesulfobacteriota bacterium]|nr:hypothetical protein [Thermodesulfobacteriota bacterium]
MKITDADIIKIGEKELIDIITGDLDWHSIEEILQQKYNLKLSDDNVAYKQGDIVVHNNQVAYKLDFDVKVTISVLFDREGECFDIVASSPTLNDAAETGEDEGGDKGSAPRGTDGDAATGETDHSVTTETEASLPDDSGSPEAAHDFTADNDGQDMADLDDLGKDNSEMASRIADMISDINRD